MKKTSIRFLIVLQFILLAFFFSSCITAPGEEEIPEQGNVKAALACLYVPDVAAADVGLPSEIALYPDVSIEWKSLSPEIIGDGGEFIKNGKAILRATARSGNYRESKDFPITLNDSLSVNYLGDNFGILSFQNAEAFPDGRIEMVASSEKTSFIEMMEALENPASIRFDYSFGTDTINDFAELKISFSTDQGENWHLFADRGLRPWENGGRIELDLSSVTGEAKLRISLETKSENGIKVTLNNIYIGRFLNEEDIISALSSALPEKVTESFVLPRTTAYGGVVSWESSAPNLIDNKGLVKKTSEGAAVTLTATVLGFKNPIIAAIEIVLGESIPKIPVEIFFIDIGKYGQNDAGEAIYIKIADFDILVDSGTYSYSFKAIREVIDANSEDRIIDYVFATHPHNDHIGNMPLVFQTYRILNVVQFSGTYNSNPYRYYADAVKNEGLISECTASDAVNNRNGCSKTIEIKDGIFIEIIDTKNYGNSGANERSVVFVLESYGTRVLFTGDGDTIEKDYMNAVGNIDILKAAHHGSKYGTSKAFLEAVDPEVVIITNGNYLGNGNGHPTWDVINRIYQYDSSVEIYAVVGGDSESCEIKNNNYYCGSDNYMADRNGTIKITISDDGYRISAEYPPVPIELSDTAFWKYHPKAEYSHGG